MTTYLQQQNEKLANINQSLDELADELARLRQREERVLQEISDALRCPECGSGSKSINHLDGCVGWCEGCGCCYWEHHDLGQVVWVDPLSDDLQAYADGCYMSYKCQQALASIWDNEAAMERKQRKHPSFLYGE